jgi:hypothetical protein
MILCTSYNNYIIYIHTDEHLYPNMIVSEQGCIRLGGIETKLEEKIGELVKPSLKALLWL